MSYGLDPVGNRLSQSSTLPGIATGTFTYDTKDRLSTETYDNNGNTTISGARTFAYDFENRVKSMNGGAVQLQYDGDGNRVMKVVGASTTRYLVDELNPTGRPARLDWPSMPCLYPRGLVYELLELASAVNQTRTLRRRF